MTGGAGNLSGSYRFPGCLVKKGNAAAAVFIGTFQVYYFAYRMGGNQRDFIFGGALLGVADGTHGIHEAVTLPETLGPELDLILTVMDEMTNTAGA